MMVLTGLLQALKVQEHKLRSSQGSHQKPPQGSDVLNKRNLAVTNQRGRKRIPGGGNKCESSGEKVQHFCKNGKNAMTGAHNVSERTMRNEASRISRGQIWRIL